MGRPLLHTKCTIKNCSGKHVAKGLCGKHYQQYRTEHMMSMPRRKNTLLSVCCSKEIYEGPAHDYGKQYCSKCKEPCYWKSSTPLPPWSGA